MAALGVAGLFLPQELLTAAGQEPIGILRGLVQLLGALLFAFATVNWIARGSLLGGIYNRPVALGNLAHFMIGALVLIKLAIAGERGAAVLVLTAVYVAFALAFTAVLFRSPVARES
jgi:hypothetical protein